MANTGRVGDHDGEAKRHAPLPEPALVARVVAEEFDLEGRGRGRLERALSSYRRSLAERRRDNGVVLQVVCALVDVARVVRRRAVAAEIDPPCVAERRVA